jgi:hypothetical protein
MKKLTFAQLPPERRCAAPGMIRELFLQIARMSGKVCLEDPAQVAKRCTYTTTPRGHLWGPDLPKDLVYSPAPLPVA